MRDLRVLMTLTTLLGAIMHITTRAVFTVGIYLQNHYSGAITWIIVFSLLTLHHKRKKPEAEKY